MIALRLAPVSLAIRPTRVVAILLATALHLLVTTASAMIIGEGKSPRGQ